MIVIAACVLYVGDRAKLRAHSLHTARKRAARSA